MACQLLLVDKNEHAWLRLQGKQICEETVVVLHVLDTVYCFMRHVSSIWPIGCDMDGSVTRLQDFIFNCCMYMRWEGGGKICPLYMPRKNCFDFVQLTPHWTKGIESIERQTGSRDRMCFIDNNPHNVSLEVLVPEKDSKSRKVSLTRLKQLLHCHDKKPSMSRSTRCLIPDILLEVS